MDQVGAARILPCRFSSQSFEEVLRAGAAEGFTFVARLHREWESGVNRFEAPSEAFVGASVADRLVGFCGLNIDRFAGDARLGRLTHLYVLPDHRQLGIGTALVRDIVSKANLHFARLRLRTRQAAAFYEKLGFSRTGEEHATHSLNLPAEV